MSSIQSGRLARIAGASTSRLFAPSRAYASCPHAAAIAREPDNSLHAATAAAVAATATTQTPITGTERLIDVTASFANVSEAAPRPYSEVPGPKPLPILGNTWR